MIRPGKKLPSKGVFPLKHALTSIFVLIFFCSSMPVYAATPNTPSNSTAISATSLQTELNAQLQQENTAVNQAQSIQNSINVLKNTINQDSAAIEQHQKNISALAAQQEKLTAQLKQETTALGNYVKNQYTNGDTPYLTYLSILVGATSFSDLINRWSYVDTVVSYYHDLKVKIAADSEAIQEKQKSEQAETAKLQTDLQAKQKLVGVLKAALVKQSDFVDSLGTAVLQSMLAQSRGQQDMNNTQSLIAAEKVQAQLAVQANYQQMLSSELKSDSILGTFSTPVKLNGQVNQLLSYAATFLGVPYTWGGTYPQFDCSSFVQYVFGHFGIALDRVTWDQFKEGQGVARNDLQAGDLVFFTTYQAGPSHVGIYIGDGIMINCDNSGVSYANINSQYWSSRYYGARRIIAAS